MVQISGSTETMGDGKGEGDYDTERKSMKREGGSEGNMGRSKRMLRMNRGVFSIMRGKEREKRERARVWEEEIAANTSGRGNRQRRRGLLRLKKERLECGLTIYLTIYLFSSLGRREHGGE